MRKHLLLLILLLFCIRINAQTSQKDSLLALLPDTQGIDRIKVLSSLAQVCQLSDPDTALHMAAQGLGLAHQLKDAESIAWCLHRLGTAHRMKGEYRESERYCLQSLQISKLINNTKLTGANLDAIGVAYTGVGSYTKALEYYLQALKTREQVHDWNGVATTLGNIGIVHTQQGNFGKAYNCYIRALKIFRALPDTRHEVAITLDNMACLYTKQGLYQKALDTYQEVYITFIQLGDKTGIRTCVMSMADIYYQRGDRVRAYEYYSQGLELSKQMRVKDAIAQNMIGIARIYAATNKTADALLFANQALLLAQESGAKQVIKAASLVLYQKHKDLKNYDKALQYFEMAHIENDSILVTENAKAGFAMQAHYDLEKKHTRMASLQHITQQTLNKYAQQKYAFLGIILTLGVIVYLLIRNIHQEKKIDQLLVKQKISELAYLNAHKIRGPVASILGLVTLFNRNNLTDEFNQVVITHIDTSAKELDRMIHEVASKTQFMYQLHEHGD